MELTSATDWSRIQEEMNSSTPEFMATFSDSIYANCVSALTIPDLSSEVHCSVLWILVHLLKHFSFLPPPGSLAALLPFILKGASDRRLVQSIFLLDCVTKNDRSIVLPVDFAGFLVESLGKAPEWAVLSYSSIHNCLCRFVARFSDPGFLNDFVAICFGFVREGSNPDFVVISLRSLRKLIRRCQLGLTSEQLSGVVQCTSASNVAIVAGAFAVLAEYARHGNCGQLVSESIGPRVVGARLLLYPQVRLHFMELALEMASSGEDELSAVLGFVKIGDFFNDSYRVQRMALTILLRARDSGVPLETVAPGATCFVAMFLESDDTAFVVNALTALASEALKTETVDTIRALTTDPRESVASLATTIANLHGF
jgi:hypothetical protein